MGVKDLKRTKVLLQHVNNLFDAYMDPKIIYLTGRELPMSFHNRGSLMTISIVIYP